MYAHGLSWMQGEIFYSSFSPPVTSYSMYHITNRHKMQIIVRMLIFSQPAPYGLSLMQDKHFLLSISPPITCIIPKHAIHLIKKNEKYQFFHVSAQSLSWNFSRFSSSFLFWRSWVNSCISSNQNNIF